MKAYVRSSESSCRICGVEASGKRLTNHISHEHGMNSREYTIVHILGGIEPTCPICGAAPRYSAFRFKRYCKDHSALAEIAGGSVGGQAEAWNKGKTKGTDERLARYASSVLGPSNHFFGRTHSQESRRKISQSKTLDYKSLEERILSRSDEFTLVTPLDEYWSRQGQYLDFRCCECGTVQQKTLQAFERGSRCYKCHPESKSNWEIEVYEYVKKLYPDAVTGDRKVLSPKEIDVYIPSVSVGIECHGLYWHSESCSEKTIDRRSHLAKFEEARKRGVRLYQFFYDEWRDKRSIVESMINHRLGFSGQRLGARELTVREISTEEQKAFFSSTHLSGYVPSRIAYGLCLNGDVIAALSLRVPRQKKYVGSLEIARFSTLPGLSVVGGLGKLVAASRMYAIENRLTSIVTYVDRRVGDGHGYESCGFKVVGDTGVDYWYTDNVLRYDRFRFRASGGRSESQVASSAHVSRIWGCGSLVMVLDLRSS